MKSHGYNQNVIFLFLLNASAAGASINYNMIINRVT